MAPIIPFQKSQMNYLPSKPRPLTSASSGGYFGSALKPLFLLCYSVVRLPFVVAALLYLRRLRPKRRLKDHGLSHSQRDDAARPEPRQPAASARRAGDGTLASADRLGKTAGIGISEREFYRSWGRRRNGGHIDDFVSAASGRIARKPESLARPIEAGSDLGRRKGRIAYGGRRPRHVFCRPGE